MISKPSEVYPSLSIVTNTEEKFIADYTIPAGFKTLPPNHALNQLYLKAVARLLTEVGQDLQMSELWICQNSASSSPIHVYFTQPRRYMVTSCCQACVFVEFDYNLSGSINCSKCLSSCFEFVHSETKENNKENISNQKLFHFSKENIQTTKYSVRKLLSSKRYRHQNLNRYFKKGKTVHGKKMTEIGQFIVQISPIFKQQMQRNIGQNQPEQRAEEKRELGCQLEELRNIIEDIFSE